MAKRGWLCSDLISPLRLRKPKSHLSAMHSSAVASCCRARVGRDSQGKKRFKALNRLVASRSDLMLNDVLRMPKEMQLNMLHFGKITGKTIGYNTLLLCAKSGTLHRQKPIKKGAFLSKRCSFFQFLFDRKILIKKWAQTSISRHTLK